MSTALSLVCPVYNEGPNITRLINGIAAQVHYPWELLLVYDRDDDTTLPPAKELAMRADLPLRLVRNEYGSGVLGALRTGLAVAPGPAVAVVMGDCSDDLSTLDRMYELLTQGYDVVCASRYMKGGSQIGAPWFKAMLSRAAGVSLHALIRMPTRDVTNNFKMYKKSLLDSVTIESRGGFEIGLELVVKAFAGGYKIAETPTTWTERTEGRSRFRLLHWLPRYTYWYWYAIRHAFVQKGTFAPNG